MDAIVTQLAVSANVWTLVGQGGATTTKLYSPLARQGEVPFRSTWMDLDLDLSNNLKLAVPKPAEDYSLTELTTTITSTGDKIGCEWTVWGWQSCLGVNIDSLILAPWLHLPFRSLLEHLPPSPRTFPFRGRWRPRLVVRLSLTTAHAL